MPAETADPNAIEAPTTPDEMTNAVMTSLADLWTDFLARLPFLAAGVGVLVVCWFVSLAVQWGLRRFLVASRFKRSLRDLILQLASVAVWVIGLVIAAVIIFPGMTPAKVLTGLGIGSVALGFAFKDIVENFLAGVLILWKFPFDPGDYIECGGSAGTVEEVTIRMTELRKTNGELVVLPNARLFKEPVIVRTSRGMRRMTEMAGVAYEADLDQARDVIQQAVAACDTVRDGQPIEIYLHGLGASSVDFAVTWWCGALPAEERASRDQVMSSVKKGLDAAGIEIPWPQQVVSFKTPLSVDRQEERDDN